MNTRTYMLIALFVVIAFVSMWIFFFQENGIYGAWNRCDRNGTYSEYYITEQQFIFTSNMFDGVGILDLEPVENGFVISNNSISDIPYWIDIDTLMIISESRKKKLLQSFYTGDKIELNRAGFDIKPFDGSNVDAWKAAVTKAFKERLEAIDCKDTRTKEEKAIETLDVEDDEEEELPIKKTEN